MQPVGMMPGSLGTKHADTAWILKRKGSPQSRAVKTMHVSILCAAMVGCCQPNDPNCRNVSIGPSGAEVAGVAIGIGAAITTVIAVEVHHAHHTLNGCVSSGPGGMQLQAHSGNKTYLLSGNTAGITAGDRVRLHGTKVKGPKHSKTDPTFLVEHETKDYGRCKLSLSPAIAP